MRCIAVFFFSSRRRHTRSYGDWSSDVCSSDLVCLWSMERGRETEGGNTTRAAELRDGYAAHRGVESEARDEVRIQRRQHVAGTGHRDDRAHAARIDPCSGEGVASGRLSEDDRLPCVVLGAFTERMTPKQLAHWSNEVAAPYPRSVDELLPAFPSRRERRQDDLRLLGAQYMRRQRRADALQLSQLELLLMPHLRLHDERALARKRPAAPSLHVMDAVQVSPKSLHVPPADHRRTGRAAAAGIGKRGMGMHPAVILERVSKRFGTGIQHVAALSDVSLRIPPGQYVSVMGQSGSGKSTLLNLVAGLEAPTSGHVVVDGHDLWTLTENARSDLRLWHIGIVFQAFNLFPNLTVEENVSWRLEFQGIGARQARAMASRVLEEVAIEPGARGRLPGELSGGEQQRVAIARALVTEPRLFLADEPTGNLDSRTGEAILNLLRQLNTERSLTVVMVTHSAYAATYGHRTIELRDGQIERDVQARRGAADEINRPRDLPPETA